MVASHAPPPRDLTWPATQAHALTGYQTSDPLVHRTTLNPVSHTSQVPRPLFALKYSIVFTKDVVKEFRNEEKEKGDT